MHDSRLPPHHSLALAALIAALSVGLTLAGGEPKAQAASARPNVLMLMTDDQRMDDMVVLPQVRRLLADQGARFKQSFVSFSNCCPSRATFLTGQYAHNHGVLGDALPYGGYTKLDNTNTLPVWLQRAGYYTAHIGKYLNEYGNPPASQPTDIPPGWTNWQGAIDPFTYQMYGYTLNENGQLVTYGDPNTGTGSPEDYQTDVYARKAVDVIRSRAGAGSPFFLNVAFLAPHIERARGQGNESPRAAPRDAGRFDTAPLRKAPSFNERDVSDKPAEIRHRPLLDAQRIGLVTKSYRDRLRSLLAVDDAVANIVEALKQTGQLNNTLIIFTSDNGFMLGEHRITDAKRVFYEESVRVPLIMRGPGIRPGTVIDNPVANSDLAPTIVALTGARAGRLMDGRSLVPLFRHPDTEWGRPILLETRTERGVRTDRYKYAENTSGDDELYDLSKDRYELRNVLGKPAYRGAGLDLKNLARLLHNCKGRTCWAMARISPRIGVHGATCRDRNIRVSAVGADRRRVVDLGVFAAQRRIAHRGAAPFEALIPGVKVDRATVIQVRIQLRDGRVVAVDRRLPACAS